MFRKQIGPKKSKKDDPIAWRFHDVSRIEAFSDAVFAFAVTLLIISLEVPKSIDELIENMKGFFAFGISFTFLFQIWYTQYLFFRRYGLQDENIIFINAAMLFVVLFYVYPLKFLFTFLTTNHDALGNMDAATFGHSFVQLMVIYGSGFVVIYLLFSWMYWIAIRHEKLLLGSSERYHSETWFYGYLMRSGIGMLSIGWALVMPYQFTWISGPMYGLIGPGLSWLHSYRRKQLNKRLEVSSS